MSLYIVDSNFFIQAHRAYYPMDIMPSFWEKIKQLALSGKIKSIDKVRGEIYSNSSHEDSLKEWCRNNLPQDFFLDTSSSIGEYQNIAQWAANSNYKNEAIQEFLEVDLADPWLVAHAKANNYIIVTYEKSAPYARKKIKIPEVCSQFNVSYIDTIGLFRELGETV